MLRYRISPHTHPQVIKCRAFPVVSSSDFDSKFRVSPNNTRPEYETNFPGVIRGFASPENSTVEILVTFTSSRRGTEVNALLGPLGVHQAATSSSSCIQFSATGLRSYATRLLSRIFCLLNEQSSSFVVGVFPIFLLEMWEANCLLDDISDARESAISLV